MTTGLPPFLSDRVLEQKAQELLTRYEQTEPPVDPVTIARGEGIEVYEGTFSDSRVSGMLKTEEGRRVIYVSDADTPVRRRYSVAHELGHAILHPDAGDFADSGKELTVLYRRAEDGYELADPANKARRRREIQANIFAACLLIPRDMLAEVLEDTDDISDLTRIFGVSRQTLGIRLSDLGIEW